MLKFITVVCLGPSLALAMAPLPTIDEWKTWTPEELEKQVSPSRWNPTKTAAQVVDEYVNISTQGTTQARQSLPNKLDILYGSLPSQKLDIYGTDLDASSPIFVWIHGGYWQEGSKDISGFFANVVHSLGFKFVAFGYTLAPSGTLEQMQQELVDALQVIFKMYPRTKIVVGGHSAGAQLAASLLTGEAVKVLPDLVNRLAGLYLVSGVYDLRPLVSTYVNHLLNLTPEEAEKLSPLFQDIKEEWTTGSLRNLIVVGDYDSPEFQRQSTGYFEIIKSQFPTEFWVSEDDDHFTIVEKLMNPQSPSSQKLQNFLLQFHNMKECSGSSKTLLGLTMAFSPCHCFYCDTRYGVSIPSV